MPDIQRDSHPMGITILLLFKSFFSAMNKKIFAFHYIGHIRLEGNSLGFLAKNMKNGLDVKNRRMEIFHQSTFYSRWICVVN